jgi:DNA-binding CsgD family transcriptional regulator
MNESLAPAARADAPWRQFAAGLPLPGAGSPSSGGEGLSWVLDEVDIGLMLVDEAGRVLMANRSALRSCGAGGACRVLDGLVHPARPSDEPAFRHALAEARDGRRSLLTLLQDADVTPVAFIPAAGRQAPDAPAALLIFGKREVCAPLSVHFFAREHGVTGAETAVLAALCNGCSPRQIADQRGIALSTVRTQIQNIRQKTGARSIGDLLRVASRLPPLMTIEMHA